MILRILITTLQCSLPAFAINQLTTLTAYVMYGLVHIMAYIRLHIVDAYSTRHISIIYTSLLGLILEDNLKLTRSGVEIGLQCCMLKRRKIILR
jgi:hypothetical protein